MTLVTEHGNRVRVVRKNAPSFWVHDLYHSLVTMFTWNLLVLVVLVYAAFVGGVMATTALAPGLCDLGIRTFEQRFVQAVKTVFFGSLGEAEETGISCDVFNLALTLVKLLVNSLVGMVLYSRLTTGRKRYHTIRASEHLHVTVSAQGDPVLSAVFFDMRSRQMVDVDAVLFFVAPDLSVRQLQLELSGSLLTGLHISHTVARGASPLRKFVVGFGSILEEFTRLFEGEVVVVISGCDARSGAAEFRKSYLTFSTFPLFNLWTADGGAAAIDYSLVE